MLNFFCLFSDFTFWKRGFVIFLIGATESDVKLHENIYQTPYIPFLWRFFLQLASVIYQKKSFMQNFCFIADIITQTAPISVRVSRTCYLWCTPNTGPNARPTNLFLGFTGSRFTTWPTRSNSRLLQILRLLWGPWVIITRNAKTNNHLNVYSLFPPLFFVSCPNDFFRELLFLVTLLCLWCMENRARSS